MVKLKFKRAAAIAIITAMVGTGTPALADPLSDQLQDQQVQLRQNQATYNDIMKRLSQSEATVQKMDNQIQEMMYQINDTKAKIKSTQQDIKASEKDIQKTQAELEDQQSSFYNRMRVMYMNGNNSYLSILLGSTSIMDFITRVDNVSKILNFDRVVIKDIKDKSAELQSKKKELTLKNENLVSLENANEAKLIELNNAKSQQAQLIAQLKSDKNNYASIVSEYQKMVDATLKQINELRDKNRTAIASRGTAQFSQDAVVVYASNFLGVPYVWGGESPSGFDCSGFTQYVFKHFGISLNRTASQQLLQGVPVSRDNLQPGDLVFFGNPVYHVGIYVGNDCFIHAPSSGDRVKITPLKYMDFTFARRVR